MPPRVPLARNTATGLSERQTGRNSFVCPSCSLWRLTKSASAKTPAYPRLARPLHSRSRPSYLAKELSTLLPATGARFATTLASRTAINPPSNVPESNRDLYASLERLKDIAGDYVNQSRIQLALRGLESERPTIRVGLLGLGRDGNSAARKLASVILADPLSDEAQWEKTLATGNNGKALLIRYGAEDDIPPLNPLVDTICVPSRALEKHNLEILITSLNAASAPASSDPAGLVESMLVPPLQTPVASTGRAGFVRYPVHKAIVVGEGIDGCMDFGRLSTVVESTILGQSGAKERLIEVALSIPREGSRSIQDQPDSSLVTAVDIDQAGAALKIFRQDVANGPLFNVKWQASNIESVKKTLTSDSTDSGAQVATTAFRPALEHHIRSTLDSTNAAITAAELVAHSAQITKTIPDETRKSIQAAISTWSQNAHTDLQVSLATALASRSWRRTSWSRLLWRVDDVGVAAEGVLRNHWLLDAEAGLAFLAGRVEQAGFFRSNNTRANFNPDYALHKNDRMLDPSGNNTIANERVYLTDATVKKNKGVLGRFFSRGRVREPTAAELLRTDTVVARVKEEGGIDILHTRPWPLAIHFTRQKLLHTLVPALQSRAQTLLLGSLTTIGGTSALGAWIYVATAGAGLYEAGAVAALGLVWSLRLLQRKWEDARGIWEGEVRESGRVVLAEVEEMMRRVVRENERPDLRAEDVAQWLRARDAVKDVQEALGKRVDQKRD